MKPSNIRAFVLGPALFVAAVGLALTASGCIVDPGPGYGSNCESDLTVDWQIETPSGGVLSCEAAGAATVVVNIDGVNYPQACPSGTMPTPGSGYEDILLQSNYASYNVTVNLEDASGNALATPQSITINVNGCGSYTTPGPAVLVVTPPSP